MPVPAVPEGRYADVIDGHRIHFHEGGRGDRHVLFIHGSGPGASGWSNFKGNYPALVEAGFHVIVPDTLGYGYSSKPEDGDYSLAYLAKVYRSLLDKLGVSKCVVIGNSQGGAVAIRMALEYPDLVEKLVLMAPGGLEQREVYMEMAGIKAMMKSFFAKEGITKESMRDVFEKQLFDSALITDEILEERYQIAVTQPKNVIGKMKVDNQEDRLADLKCPILCLWGRDDQFCPVSGAFKVAQRCSHARTVIVSECGHWVMVEHRELFNRLCTDFLSGRLG